MNTPVGLPSTAFGAGHLRLRGVEDVRPAAELGGQVDDRHDDDEVDQGVLDERDDRRSAQAARVGVGREQRERDEQRQVLGDDAVAAAEADDLEHRLDADQLQRDVGHRREEAGDRHGERQPARAEPAAHEVGRGDVAVPVADRPHPAHEDEDDRVEHDRVGHGEEPGHRAGRPHRRRHRDERVGRVEVAAEQEPGDPGAERAAAEAPLVERLHARRAAPPAGPEAHDGDQREQHDEHGQGDSVDVVHARSPRRRPSGASPAAHSLPSAEVVHRPVRPGDEHDAVGRVGERRGEEDPEELVPDEERERRPAAVRRGCSCSPTSGR